MQVKCKSVLDCSLEVNKFKFQLHYYIHFQMFGKGMIWLDIIAYQP